MAVVRFHWAPTGLLDGGRAVRIGWAHSVVTAALACLVLLLIARATLAPIISYNFWWYHLPFASCLWNIGGGCDSFRMDARLLGRFQGFPKLWELVQGGVWSATGVLGSIVLPQLLLCAAYFWTCVRELRVPAGQLAIVFLSCPMIVLHFCSTNNDLPGAFAIAIGFFLFTGLLATAASEPSWPVGSKVAGAVTALMVAGNIKYQSQLGCLATTAALGVVWLSARGIATGRRVLLLLILVIATVAASSWAIANYLRFDNPFYPFQVSVAGRTVFRGPENRSIDAEPPAYLIYGSGKVWFPEPVNFVLSLTSSIGQFAAWPRGTAWAARLVSSRGAATRVGPAAGAPCSSWLIWVCCCSNLSNQVRCRIVGKVPW